MELRLEAVKRLTVDELNEMRFNKRCEECMVKQLKPLDIFHYDYSYCVCTRITKKLAYFKKITIPLQLPYIKTVKWRVVHPVDQNEYITNRFTYYYLDADRDFDKVIGREFNILLTDTPIKKTRNHSILILENVPDIPHVMFL